MVTLRELTEAIRDIFTVETRIDVYETKSYIDVFTKDFYSKTMIIIEFDDGKYDIRIPMLSLISGDIVNIVIDDVVDEFKLAFKKWV